MGDGVGFTIGCVPYDPGTIVHITPRASEDLPHAYHHKHACEIVSVYQDYTEAEPEPSHQTSGPTYAYQLSPVTTDLTLPTLYPHSHLCPSPRGYGYITGLLGQPLPEDPPEWERTLGKFKRSDLELIDTLLSVVDFDADPTQDWLRELRKGNIDRTNSIFAEMLLLYYLRLGLRPHPVTMNAVMGEDSEGRDVDIRAITPDHDLWFDIYKPDYVAQIPEGGGFLSTERTGTAVGNKLRDKFDDARKLLPDEAVIILAVYLVEPVTQRLQLGQWLKQGYFDISEYCDGLLTFTHFAERTDFTYYPQTDRGKACEEVINSIFVESAT